MAHYLIYFLAFVFFCLLVVILFIEPEEEASLDYQRIHGKFRVLYSDGWLSQPMNRKTARDYAEMFDGRVVLREYQHPTKTPPTIDIQA
jgi:hypothetical protein